jgi:hypothetical protein
MAGEKTTAPPRPKSGTPKTYNSGQPCLKGHFLRYVKSDRCAVCSRAEVSARWHRKSPEEKRRRWDKGRTSAHVRRQMRDSILRNRYGISIEEYEAILASQGGVCAICGGTEVFINRVSRRRDRHVMGSLPVDHCHRTGEIRGILCSRCNFVVAYARDNPDTLDRAAAYLRTHQK